VLFRPPPPEIGWPPYLWLLYLAPFLARPLAGGAAPLELVATAGLLLVFLWSYFRAYWASPRGRLAHVALQASPGLVLLPWNPGAAVFVIYAAGAAGLLEPERHAWRTIAAVTVGGTAWAWLVGARPEPQLAVLVVAPLVGAVTLHQARGRRAAAALRAATARNAELAATAERERIARDLHDALGHTLSLVVLKAQVARRLVTPAGTDAEADGAPAAREALRRELRELEEAARGALTEVRRAVRGYRATLDDAVAAARALLDAAGVTLAVEVALGEPDAERDAVLAAVLRELTTNVARHAGARHCRLVVREDAAATTLTVGDDGRGGALAGRLRAAWRGGARARRRRDAHPRAGRRHHRGRRAAARGRRRASARRRGRATARAAAPVAAASPEAA
jgi:two-component system sensor histidine kinase DesK